MRIIFHFIHHRFLNPLKQFIHDSRSIGIILLSCTIISLLFANQSFTGNGYTHLLSFNFNGINTNHLTICFLQLPNTPQLVINDFMMAFFFFLAGMEIKRELLHGELASLKQSLLPVAAAIGGMIAPAIVFAFINQHTKFISGWGIPMATDIAFTLGVASLLGARVPLSLKIFITALAIIDDLGAIGIIALFYGGSINLLYLAFVILLSILIFFVGKKKNTNSYWYWPLGLLLWYCMFNSGIHATGAGVLMAFSIPTSKLQRLELFLHIPVYFIILPLFVFANTAIVLPDNGLLLLNSSVSWGIIAGLCLGKPLGICAAVLLLVKLNLANLPTEVNTKQLIGASILCGIGFTMSIFISTLAFESLTAINTAKIAVLFASSISMICGFTWLRFCKPSKQIIS